MSERNEDKSEDKSKGKSNVAKEMQPNMEKPRQARREEERRAWEDLNQSIQTGTHDIARPGIKWGPSYKTRRKRPSHS